MVHPCREIPPNNCDPEPRNRLVIAPTRRERRAAGTIQASQARDDPLRGDGFIALEQQPRDQGDECRMVTFVRIELAESESQREI